MTSLFLVTSAIYTSYGKCSTEERIEQTKETIKSIKNYATDSTIVLLDAGEKSTNIDFGVELIDYTSNPIIINALEDYFKHSQSLNHDVIVKSMLEILIIENYLKYYPVNSYSRVFKLSGRYKLNSNFNYKKHLQSNNKVVILSPRLSPHLYNFDIASSMFSYMTRCWSFDSSLVLNIKETFDKMKNDIVFIYKNQKQGDIEHLLYKHLNKKLVKHINVMGVEGHYAPNKEWIEE